MVSIIYFNDTNVLKIEAKQKILEIMHQHLVDTNQKIDALPQKDSILLILEMLPLLKAKGDKPKIGNLVMLHLPAGLIGFILQKITVKALLQDILWIKRKIADTPIMI